MSTENETVLAEAETEDAATGVRAYELMIILNPDLLEGKSKKKFGDLEEFIAKEGGKVTHSDVWGKQKMAYRIKKFNEGIYAVYNLELPAASAKELNDLLRIDPEVIRHLLITVPKDYTYTAFYQEKEEAKPEEKPGRERERKKVEKRVFVRDEVPMKKEEDAPKPAEKKTEKVDEQALDKKLDAIFSDADLNL